MHSICRIHLTLPSVYSRQRTSDTLNILYFSGYVAISREILAKGPKKYKVDRYKK